MYMYLIEASIVTYLVIFLIVTIKLFLKYIRAVLWMAKFKVVYHMQYSSYQYCFHVRILGTILIREVLLGMHICSSNSVSLFTRWMYLLH